MLRAKNKAEIAPTKRYFLLLLANSNLGKNDFRLRMTL